MDKCLQRCGNRLVRMKRCRKLPVDWFSHHFQQGVHTHPGYSLLHFLRNLSTQVVRDGLTLLGKKKELNVS